MRKVKIIDKEISTQKKDEIRNEFFKSSVHNMTTEDLEKFLAEHEHNENIHCRGDKNTALTNCFRMFFSSDDLDTNGFPIYVDIEKITELHRRSQSTYIELLQHARRTEITSHPTVDINGDEMRIIDRINRLIQLRSDAYEQVLLYERQMNRINNPTIVQDESMFMGEDDEKTPYQELLIFLLNITDKQCMRRYKGYCCQQIITQSGYKTRAWKYVMPITDFVYHQTQKETHYNMWKKCFIKLYKPLRIAITLKSTGMLDGFAKH